VRRAAAAINNATSQIDILINNAAIMACPYAKTEDGIESQFGTNYIGHFLLTNLLIGKMQSAVEGGARIVNLTSTGSAAGEANFDDINFDVSLINTSDSYFKNSNSNKFLIYKQDGKTYNPIAGYAQSKIAIILFTVSLSKKFDSKQIASFSVHPGSKSTHTLLTCICRDSVLTAYYIFSGITTGLQKHFQDPVAFKEIVEYVEAKIGGE
jgi:NAD(P)-dependent dehydrogenase (short-subunit alcohol dehydrogenase family)